ncbi:MAG: MoaD family protein [Anaerolineaceae bacterium]|nr:MoaD family protein [Anaerolineaceae bacterium]
MQVNLFSTYRSHAGEKSFQLDLPSNSSVWNVVQEILKNYPGLKKHWINKEGQLFTHVHICVNQVDVETLPDRLSTRLSEEDVLDIFPPISGG